MNGPTAAVDPLLPARFLFRFSAPCLHYDGAWTAQGIELSEAHGLPSFGELEGQLPFADVRIGWNAAGLILSVHIEGKKHALWCRETKPQDSDGLRVWVDMRDTRNVHRATRFCHQFIFLPAGGGRTASEPVADQLLVERARENSQPVRPGQLGVHSDVRADGYRLSAFIPTAALTGYRPEDHPRLGFTYVVFDREHGEQAFSIGSEYPFPSDPSLWGTLELVK